MSTHSCIGRRYADGTFKSIHCSNDGYLKHNGKILYENYLPTEEGIKKVEELLSLGNLYFLGKNIGVEHSTTGVKQLDYDFFKNNNQCCF